MARPVITSQSGSLEVVVDQPASFSILASGSGLTYQWQLSQDGGATYNDILYATSPQYNLKYAALSDAGLYRCSVSNGVCTAVYSTPVSLTVFPVLTIDKHPGKATACEGGDAKFVISASNATGYQWEIFNEKAKLWEAIAGAVDAVYITDKYTTYNGAQFHCVVYGGAGQSLTSYTAILTVKYNVAIVSHPASATKTAGESVTFNVSASGSVTGYQWKLNNVAISGANSASYTIPAVQAPDAGSYTCTVTGYCNSVTSNAAVLTVNVPAYPNGWFKQTSGSGLNIVDIAPISENEAWAVTSDQDKLLHTTNGGDNWSSVVTGSVSYWKSIYFISSSIGMVGGYNGIARTTDNGATWTYSDLRNLFGLSVSSYFYVYNIAFSDANNGWLVGLGGFIAKTSDGGASWTKINFKNDASPITDVDLYSVYAQSSSIVYVGGASGKLYKTVNGGTNWTELTTGATGYIKDIAFTSSTNGFFVTDGSYKGLYSTTNSGTSWSKVADANIPAYIYPVSIDFVDANNGWMAGSAYDGEQKPAIMKTYDGGVHWVSQKITDIGYLNKIRMFNSNHGWVSGSGGLIHRTGKGGCYDPVVSLYADQTLCANQTYTLVADTFSNNYNSRYSWSNSSTAGHITVNTTANYSVTITNECNVTATDNATITFLALPVANAGEDVAICQGESAQLLATGGTGYSWNNAGYLNDNTIANPVATPPTGQTTAFTVTVTDAAGCSSTDAVNVTVNALPTSDFTAPVYVCGTSQGAFTYSGSAAGKTFTWDFGGGEIMSGSNQGPVNVRWSELGDKLVSLTTAQNNCSSAPTLKIVNVRAKPTADFIGPEANCGANAAVLMYSGSAPSDALYSWGVDGGTITSGTGQGPIQVSWATGGNKNVSLSVTQNECVSDVVNNSVEVSYPYEGEQICIVTIDLETGKNMVVWEKTHNVGIASYNVYREGNILGSYELIGNVPFDDISLYVDLASKPEQQQYKYKISAVDTCGNESAKSPWHKTMFLQYVSSVSGVNLNWQEYQTETGSMSFASYDIFRGSDSTALTKINTISASFLAYTDATADALSRRMYYRVGGVKALACNPAELAGKKASSGPFVHSLSNLEDNRLQSTGISNKFADALNLSIYPSPFNEVATISYNLTKTTKMKVEVYNVVGEKIALLLDETQMAGAHKLEMKAADVNYTNGLYYVRFMVDDAVIVRKTMLSK